MDAKDYSFLHTLMCEGMNYLMDKPEKATIPDFMAWLEVVEDERSDDPQADYNFSEFKNEQRTEMIQDQEYKWGEKV